ncbi:MAG: tetratricopeptide repeat protein [Pirellulales bacterium]
MSTSDDPLARAFAHHQRGELAQAEQLYRQVLASQPRHADAWHLLGLVAHQAGRHAEAAQAIEQAVAISEQPNYLNHLGAVYAALQQYGPAEASFRRALAVSAADSQAHYNLAALLNQFGRKDEAEASYREAVRLNPQFAEAHFNLGNLLRDLHRLTEAEACYAAAVAARPNYLKALISLAVAQSLLGNYQQTEPLWRRILQVEPNHVDALYRLGSLLQLQNRLAEAAPLLQRAVLLDPKHSAAQSNLGCVYRGLGESDRAEQCFRLALSIQPDSTAALVNFASLLHDRKDHQAAAAYCRKVLELEPNSFEAHHVLGGAYHSQKQYEPALVHFRRAVELNPNSADAAANVGAALLMLGQTDEAFDQLQRAIALDPRHIQARYCLGGACHQQGRSDEALAAYDEALRVDPDSAETHFYRSFIPLSRGDFEEGWREYSWRLKCKDFKLRSYQAPLWDGSPLDGRSLMVLAEQGLGDTLHFIRYLNLLKQQRGVVYVDVQPELVSLLKASGFTGVIARGSELPGCDLSVPLLSLPGLLETRLATIPGDVPYLAADPRSLKQWRARLPGGDVFKVGIVWQGNPGYMFDHLRSIPLVEFAPLAEIKGVQLFSLQKGTGVEQLASAGRQFPVHELGSSLESFLDTAAAICNLDLVISCDTAVAHLAGGLGLPVWLALPKASEWRWLTGRTDSPWYPTMRLFRQSRGGDWGSVFAYMKKEITLQVDARSITH